MKKILALLLCVAMLACLLTGCGSDSSKTDAPADADASASAPADTAADTASDASDASDDAASGDKVVRIGVFEPQTGDNGAGGKQEILGMQYANYVQPTVEIGGETYEVKLEIVDNRTSAANGPSAAAELMNRDVSIVLGSYGSGVSMAGGEVFAEAGVPAIGVTCTNPQVTADCDVYFRICFLDPFQGTVLANYAKNELKATKAYCLAKQGDDYSGGLANYFIKAFGEENCVYEQFPEGTSDFSTYITNAQQQGCDVFFSPVSLEAAAQIIAKAETQSLGMPILAGDTWDSNVVLEAAKGTSLNICVTTFYQEGVNAEFDSAIKEWINSDATAKTNNGGDDKLSAVTVMGYDAYCVALEAIKAADSTDPAAVLAALPGVTYEGITGAISFNDIGDANRDSAVVKKCNTESGNWDFVTVAKVG